MLSLMIYVESCDALASVRSMGRLPRSTIVGASNTKHRAYLLDMTSTQIFVASELLDFESNG
jgi:hypothetical protein